LARLIRLPASRCSFDLFRDELRYPMADARMSPDRKAAELFARLGTLYFADPTKVQRLLPKAYETLS
jgi:hypothetical protein